MSISITFSLVCTVETSSSPQLQLRMWISFSTFHFDEMLVFPVAVTWACCIRATGAVNFALQHINEAGDFMTVGRKNREKEESKAGLPSSRGEVLYLQFGWGDSDQLCTSAPELIWKNYVQILHSLFSFLWRTWSRYLVMTEQWLMAFKP